MQNGLDKIKKPKSCKTKKSKDKPQPLPLICDPGSQHSLLSFGNQCFSGWGGFGGKDAALFLLVFACSFFRRVVCLCICGLGGCRCRSRCNGSSGSIRNLGECGCWCRLRRRRSNWWRGSSPDRSNDPISPASTSSAEARAGAGAGTAGASMLLRTTGVGVGARVAQSREGNHSSA